MTQQSANQPPPPSTRYQLAGIWRHLSPRRRIQLGFLISVMLISGLAELVSLGAVLPFLTALSNPELLWQEPLVQALSGQVGWTKPSQLLLPAILGFAAAALFCQFVFQICG